MNNNILYKDSLIEILKDSITLRNYYFPTLFPKKISFEKIEYIECKKPTLVTGKWRFWGTGDFKTWFPADFSRNKRESIFLIHQKQKRIVNGFTVENAEMVKNILREKYLLK